jgi:hypothetical protein
MRRLVASTWTARYQFNDVLLYSRTSKETGIEKGEYARVKSVDAPNNLVTLVRSTVTSRPMIHSASKESLYTESRRRFS